MSDEITLLQRRLKREQSAREASETLLEQKSLELWEANRQLTQSLDEKTQELSEINAQLSNALEDTSKELVENLKLLNEYKKAIDYSTLVSMTDKNGIITYANDAFCKVSGYTQEELIGHPHNIIRHPDNSRAFFREIWNTILAKKPWHGVIKNRSKSGNTYYVDSTLTPILDQNGEIKNFLALRYDITDVIEQKQRINKQLRDRLTGLPNRTKLIEDLDNNEYKALGLLNIDAFQEVNDLYGQMIGDQLLRSVAIYLQENIDRDHCYLYKLQADEYAIGSKLPFDNNHFKEVVHDMIQRLAKHTFMIDDNEIHINVTGGISYGSGIQLLSHADIAKKKAKAQKQPFLVFDENMQEKERYANNQEVLKILKDAIENDRIVPYFQPIFSNKTMEIKKYEALIRMIDNEGKVISPYTFLDIAKKSRIYPQLTKIMIDKVFDLFKDKDRHFTINLSIEDILDTDMNIYLFNALSHFPKPQNVIFEITESEGISNYNQIKEFIQKLKKYDSHVAIDDFGSGYSNFMHLLELNIDYIKIDGSIIKKILTDMNSQVLTRAIVSVAKELDMKVIAEFVSDEDILNAVREIGVDLSQGFYLGKPSPSIA